MVKNFFYHDHVQNFKVFVVKGSEILTMTLSKVQIFYGQFFHLTITIGKIQTSRGQNSQPEISLRNRTKMCILTIDHGTNSRISVAMVKLF